MVLVSDEEKSDRSDIPNDEDNATAVMMMLPQNEKQMMMMLPQNHEEQEMMH